MGKWLQYFLVTRDAETLVGEHISLKTRGIDPEVQGRFSCKFSVYIKPNERDHPWNSNRDHGYKFWSAMLPLLKRLTEVLFRSNLHGCRQIFPSVFDVQKIRPLKMDWKFLKTAAVVSSIRGK